MSPDDNQLMGRQNTRSRAWLEAHLRNLRAVRRLRPRNGNP